MFWHNSLDWDGRMEIATVIHFGKDDSQRVPALRHVGYEVRESDSLDRLRLNLEGDEADAVIVSEVEPRCAEKAAILVRQCSGAPLILFRRLNATLDESRFDRVYSLLIPTSHWLFEMAVIVMQSKELRAASERLRREVETVRAESRQQSARAKAEQQRNADAGGPWELEGDEKDGPESRSQGRHHRPV